MAGERYRLEAAPTFGSINYTNLQTLQLLLGTSESVPVLDGDLQLGTWQRIFLVELDGPRPEREVLVQVLGSTE